MILKIGKHNFACCASWSRLLDNQDPVEQVKNNRKRYYTIINSEELNIRYLGCYNIVKSQSKLISLPSILIDIVNPEHDSFIFIHRIDNRLYIVAYRDGVLDIKTDKALSINDAHKFIHEYKEKHDVTDLYCFEKYTDAGDLFIENIHVINPNKIKTPLKPHYLINADKFGSSIKNALVLLVCLSFLGWAAYFMVGKYFPDTPVAKKVVKKGPTQAEINAYKLNAVKDKLASLYLAPYSSDLLLVCQENKSLLPLSPHFWEMGKLTCTSGGINFVYQRTDLGMVPSEFKSFMLSEYPVSKASISFSIPAKVNAEIEVSYRSRDYVPSSLDDISETANINILDILSRFSDIQGVNSLTEAKPVAMGYHELKGEQIIFKDSDVYKQGSFVLRSTIYKDLINANSLFDSDYIFLNNITKSGDFYDATFNYITL